MKTLILNADDVSVEYNEETHEIAITYWYNYKRRYTKYVSTIYENGTMEDGPHEREDA